MTVLKLLQLARKRIADPKSWTQGAFARDKNGDTLWPTHRDAVCWCARGALEASANLIRDDELDTYAKAVVRLKRHAPGRTVTRYNDRQQTTHADVLRWFDRAIEAERKARAA